MAGPATAVKALRACLAQPKGKFALYFQEYEYPFRGQKYQMQRDGDGYRSYTTPLGLGTWHMVLVAKRPGFLPCVSEEAVWQVVNSSQHTTPLMRAWAGWLYQEMKARPMLLKRLDCFGCECGTINLTDERLDQLVVEGVKRKELVFF